MTATWGFSFLCSYGVDEKYPSWAVMADGNWPKSKYRPPSIRRHCNMSYLTWLYYEMKTTRKFRFGIDVAQYKCGIMPENHGKCTAQSVFPLLSATTSAKYVIYHLLGFTITFIFIFKMTRPYHLHATKSAHYMLYDYAYS